MNWLIILLMAAPEVATPPKPVAGALEISEVDYPVEARTRGETGTVGATIAVDEQGKVAGCSVAQSSGSPSLDAQTCALIRQRARFSPARDASGKAIAAVVSQNVSWALPKAVTGPIGEVEMRFDRSGTPESCQVIKPTGHGKTDRNICNALVQRTDWKPRTSVSGRRIPYTQRISFTVTQ